MSRSGIASWLATGRRHARALRRALLGAALLGGFLGLVGWFGAIDVYHRHFSQAGALVAGYNLCRVVFAAYLVWLVYFAGHVVMAAAAGKSGLRDLSLAERFVLGFGTGAGIWHVVMLVLGVAGMFYRSLLMVLCLVVLLMSVKHFEEFASEAAGWISGKASAWRERRELVLAATVLLILSAAALLLLGRGLYPGGGHDYYTHYFYYYHDVIRNHGLAPNDVWYHYYYSKGAGLFFLAISMTDLQAPELVTFSCAAIAALALATLAARVAPGSLWPAVCTVLYLVYLLGLGGEFQKIHEKMSALLVIAAWAACMFRIGPRSWEVPCLIAAGSATIAIAILTPSMGGLLAVVFGVCAARAMARRMGRQSRGYALVSVAAGCAAISVLLLNYRITGLALDQGLDLTWRLANLERLDQWGVIPQLTLIAWIRDNYASLAPPPGWETVRQLRGFLRLNALWLPLGGGIIALYAAALRRPRSERERSSAREVVAGLGLFVGMLGLLSVALGRSQAVSYLRFSTFFFPLLALFAVACWAVLLDAWRGRPKEWVLRLAVPGLLLIAVPFSSQVFSRAMERAYVAMGHALQFAAGRYSLADAYRHQEGRDGYWFGAIHPGTLAAMRHAGQGTRIWSMHVSTYCLVPECRIESVSSFKMSRRLNEILNGPPAEARRILEEEGLNYFLFSTDFLVMDLLPYGRLFAPSNIAEHLGIQWTDGKTYLLTWRDRSTRPIDQDFLASYRKGVSASDHPWFRFSLAVPHIDRMMRTLEASPHPWRPIDFPWRQP